MTFNVRSPLRAPEWAEMSKATLEDPRLKKGLKLLWFATGQTDSLMPTTTATVDLLRKHGFTPEFKESPGGHAWINWRAYLIEFVPRLFK